MPVYNDALLKKLYKDQPEKLKESLVRNNELYAIADQFHEFVAGVLISMEEQNAKTDGFDTSAISNVKVALMGPLAGVGDSFFLGTLRVLAIGIGRVADGGRESIGYFDVYSGVERTLFPD